jgi:hypothetical protein
VLLDAAQHKGRGEFQELDMHTRAPAVVFGLACVGTVSACGPTPSGSQPPAQVNAWQMLQRAQQTQASYGSAHGAGWTAVKLSGPAAGDNYTINVTFQGDSTLIATPRWRMWERLSTSHLGRTVRFTMGYYRLGGLMALTLPFTRGWHCMPTSRLASMGLKLRQVSFQVLPFNRIAKAWVVRTGPAGVVHVEAVLKNSGSSGAGRSTVGYAISESTFMVQSILAQSSFHRAGRRSTVTSYMTLSHYGEPVPAWLPMCHHR